MYESPIQLYLTDIQTKIVNQREEQILKAVQSMGVDVNREELIRALKYDREQYAKGYNDAMESIVRCKDCKWYEENTEARTRFCRRELGYMYATPDGFCSYGERRVDHGKDD